MKILVKEIREKAGLSQNKLAELSGVAQATLWSIEHEETSPRISTLAAIAKTLNCDISDLVETKS